MTYPQYPPPPGFPASVQPGYPQQVPSPFPQGGYANPQPGYPGQGFPQQPPAQPLPQGTLADFYGQPSSAGAPAISWKDQPIGYGVAFVVERDVTSADVKAQTDPGTGQLRTYRDGRPKYQLAVPILVAPDPVHPEGRATLYVGGQMRDELSRAMAEAGAVPSEGGVIPRKGDAGFMQIVQRKPTRMGNPQNIFACRYQLANVAAPAPAQPADPGYTTSVDAPVQQALPMNSGLDQDAAIAQALAAAQAQAAAQTAPATPAPAGPPPPAAGPIPQPGQPPVITQPAGLSPEAEAVFAKLAAQNPANHPTQ